MKHLKYIELAKLISTWSKDPSRGVGAVTIGHKGQVLSQGYNGFPRRVEKLACRLDDRDEKYKFTVHAEMNAIYNATYNGVSLDGASLYVYGLPICLECAKGVIQVGIKAVYMPEYSVVPSVWEYSTKYSKQMFKEAGVEYNTVKGCTI